MNIERLKLMSTMLREVAAGTWNPTAMPDIGDAHEVLKHDGVRFDLEQWIDRDPDSKGYCGFSACAVGHAMLDERFELTAQYDSEGVLAHPRAIVRNDLGYTTGWPAVRHYFELDEEEAAHLFNEWSYHVSGLPTNDPATVANRIDNFIANGGIPCSND